MKTPLQIQSGEEENREVAKDAKKLS